MTSRNKKSTVIVVSGIVCIWIIASMQFGFSVEIADMCDDTTDVLIQAVDHGMSFNDTMKRMGRFYIYCDADHADNPLNDILDPIHDAMITIDDTVENGPDWLRIPLNFANKVNNVIQAINVGKSNKRALNVEFTKGLNGYMSNLKTQADMVVAQYLDLIDSMHCDNLHVYRKKFEQHICYDFMYEWYSIYVLQFVMTSLILLQLVLTYVNCVCTSVSSRIQTIAALDNLNIAPRMKWPVEGRASNFITKKQTRNDVQMTQWVR